MKYNWTKYSLQDRLEDLKRLKRHEEDKKKLREICFSIEILEEYLNELEDISLNEASLIENLDDNATYYTDFKFVSDDIINFSLDDLNKNVVDQDLKKLCLSKKDILTITHDFYKSQDKEIYKHFLNTYKRRSDHVRFINEEESYRDSVTYSIPYLNECFIQIYKADTIESLFNSIHEFAHPTSVSFNNYHLNDEGKRILVETEPAFYELILADYLAEHCNFGDESLYTGIKHNGLLFASKEIANIIELTRLHKECCFKDNKRLKSVANAKLNFTPEYVEDLIGTDFVFQVPYLESYLFAVELYELYKFDKEKALFILKKFINLNSMQALGYYKQTKRLGLYPLAHMKEFSDDLEYKLTLKK